MMQQNRGHILNFTDCMQLNWLGKSSSHKTYIGHRKYWMDTLVSLQLDIIQTDRCKIIEWDRQYNTDLTVMSRRVSLLYFSDALALPLLDDPASARTDVTQL